MSATYHNEVNCKRQVPQHDAAWHDGKRIHGVWQNGIETLSGYAQRKLRLSLAKSLSRTRELRTLLLGHGRATVVSNTLGFH